MPRESARGPRPQPSAILHKTARMCAMAEGGSGLVTILFTDLVGSTELLSRAGDEEAQRIFRAHHDLLAEAAAAHGGQEVKWLGDGLMVAFPSRSEERRVGEE